MAAQWRPANSSDDDDDDDRFVAPISTKDLLARIDLESSSIPKKADNVATVRSLSLSPIRDQDATENDQNPPPLPRPTSTDSIVELLRSSGIASETRDSRKVQWRHQKFAENPNLPSGCLVSGTKNLYLNDDFFVFRDSAGELLRQPVVPSAPVLPMGNPEPVIHSMPVLPKNNPDLAVKNTHLRPLENPTKSKGTGEPRSTKTNPIAPVVQKKPTKGKKRNTWKKLSIDDMPADKLVPGPGPPEEKGSGRTRFC